MDVERLLRPLAPPNKIRAFQRSLLRWFACHGRDLPWRRTQDPYAILVSEVMLQQTQVATVIPYYREWLRRFPNFASLARASENEVLLAWQGLGYYARARNLQATAITVLKDHRGRFPRSIEKIQQLPGIGKYTAHAVASFAFNQSVPIVEANTARVFTRLFNFRQSIDSSSGRRMLWQHAADLLPNSGARTFNSALLDLGALICVVRNPKCDLCPVKSFCRATNPAALPVKKSGGNTKRLIETHALIVSRGRILLQQSRHRWRGMWILPPLDSDGSIFQAHPVYRCVFPFTHHRITLVIYRHRVPRKIAPEQQWVRAIEDVPMPSPHRRAIEALTRNNGNFSVQREQRENSRRSRQNRNRNAEERIVPKADL